MLIHQLKMSNFKSYLGEHTLGPFNPHFTCIIGPNGNGKSNIIDAVLFVFGFKSSKLRQDSLASLIHKSAYGQPDKASVEVIFRENNEEISVSRTVTKSNNTSYKMNGSKIGWGELREILVKKKIDLNKNLFIILQGEVERLCELSPQTMVDYLQYVSGSDQFKQPIDQAEKVYIEASIKRQQTKTTFNLKKKMFDIIDQKARNVTISTLIKLRVNMLQHLIIKKTIMDNAFRLEHLKKDQENKLSIIQTVEDQIRAIDQEIKKFKKEILPLDKSIVEEENKLEGIEKQFQSSMMKFKEAQRQITFLANDKEKKNQEKKRFEKEKTELKQISEHQKDFVERVKMIKSSLSQEKHLSKLQLCLQFTNKITKLSEQQKNLKMKNSEEQTQLTLSRQKLTLFIQKSAQNKIIKQELKAQLRKIQSDKKETDSKLSETTQTVQQLQRQLKMKSTQRVLSISNQQKIISQIRSANKLKIICPQLTLVTLRQVVVLNAVYRQVIQTILPQLDYFIVENVNQAKQVSQYLNKKKIGRMTFLIKELINVAVKDINIVHNCPQNTKVIVELIKTTDNEARNILIWALGNTLVANDLETAMKVAYYDQKKYRVITTKGQFIDSSGTMTKLTLKQSSSEDSQFLEKKVATLKRLSQNLIQQKNSLERKEKENTQRMQGIMSEERDFDGLDEVILNELQKQIAKDKSKIAKNELQLTVLNENLSKLEKELLRVQFNMQTYEDKLAMLRELAQNEEKVKKIQNSDKLYQNLEFKVIQVQSDIQQMVSKMQARMRVKIGIETDQAKLNKQIQNKKLTLYMLRQAKTQLQAKVSELQSFKRQKLGTLGDTARPNTSDAKLRQELNKLKSISRAVQYQQLQLKNKLQNSLGKIRQFSQAIYKHIFRGHPQLVPTQEEEEDQSTQSIVDQVNPVKEVFKGQPLLQLGKTKIKFISLLSQAEKTYLFSSSSKQIQYRNSQDIFPSITSRQLLFESLQTRQFKMSHTYEMQKLKHHQKDKQEGMHDNNDEYENYQLNSDMFSQYKQNKDQYENVKNRMSQIEEELKGYKQRLIKLRNERLSLFMRCFNDINVQLNRIYTKLTGGRAQLNLLDSLNPFQGVQFSIRPLNKSWKRVNLLSGGQKTFTSLALIFACQQLKQFPFYFMDEIDAALDYKNTTLLAQYIKEKVNKQYIVISLRKNMYQQCRRVVGIWKVKDVSRNIEIDMEELRGPEERDYVE